MYILSTVQLASPRIMTATQCMIYIVCISIYMINIWYIICIYEYMSQWIIYVTASPEANGVLALAQLIDM